MIITGLLITYIALNLMDGHGQPALLYIVPFILGKSSILETQNAKPMESENGLLWPIFSGTLIVLGHKRGDLKTLWTTGEPERPCPHVRLQPQS